MNVRISGNYTRNGVTESARWERWQPAGCWEETERKKRNAASQQFLLKIYSVQLHEKYHLVPLVSRRFVSHLGGCLGSSIFSPFFSCPPSLFLFCLIFRSTFPALYLCPLYLVFLAFMRSYVSLAQRARTRYSFFSVTMPSGAWHAEQFRICDYASRTISQLIGGAGKARADAYPIARYILNYTARKTSGINHKSTDQFPSF